MRSSLIQGARGSLPDIQQRLRSASDEDPFEGLTRPAERGALARIATNKSVGSSMKFGSKRIIGSKRIAIGSTKLQGKKLASEGNGKVLPLD